MKRLLIMSLLATSNAFAFSAEDQIRNMAGCYEVTFEFTETFLRKSDHPVRSAPYREHGIEWVEVDKDQEGQIELQHILLTPGGPLKHWRQEWIKQPESIWTFHGRTQFSDKDSSLKWTKKSLSASPHAWLQRVTQVDDSPRYECVANWVNTGTDVFWECLSPAPLPRREFSKRDDYDVLLRRNRHQITENGWLHEQDNQKFQSEPKIILAEEKGLNTYRKIEDQHCEVAKTWWKNNKKIWHFVQSSWNDLRQERNLIELKGTVQGQTLWSRLFQWAEVNKSNHLTPELKAELNALIGEHL